MHPLLPDRLPIFVCDVADRDLPLVAVGGGGAVAGGVGVEQVPGLAQTIDGRLDFLNLQYET